MQLNWGWIGIAAYGISYGLSNLFAQADGTILLLDGTELKSVSGYENAVALWFAGLYGVFAMYALLWWLQTRKQGALILCAILLAANAVTRDLPDLELPDFWAEYGFGPQLWVLGLLVCITWTVWLIFREFDRSQLFERCVWATLLIGFEGWAIIEHISCKMIGDQATQAWLMEHWGRDVSKYSCRRWAGDFWPQIDQALVGLVLLYFAGRYAWARGWLRRRG